MSSPEHRSPWRTSLPAGVAVAPLFLALAVSLAGFVAYYWFGVLAPQLDANARANATALANSQAQILVDAMSGAEAGVVRRRLAGAMDEILIAREPTTGEPIFLGLKTEIDYDVLRAPAGSLDIDKENGRCGDCLEIAVPLYARTSRELLGIAHFKANLLFVQELKNDVRDKLSVGAALSLVIVAGIWWAVAGLLRKIVRSERNLRTVFQAAPVPMVLVRRRDGLIVRGNRAAEALFGVPAQELADRPIAEFHRETPSDKPLSGPDAGEQGVDGREIGFADRRGGQHWVLASAYPVHYYDQPAHILSYADITALKRIQQELTVARDAAEAATRAKSMFVANMSHEIRTPLNAVIGFCHLAERTTLDQRQRGYLVSIRKATDSLLEIINNILDFSKLDASKMALERVDFRLADVVGDLLDMFRVLADQRGLTVDVEVAPSVPGRLNGDPQRLKQVLINLLANALKFTEEGGVQLRVGLADAFREGVLLRFDVVDSGIGIAEEAVPSLFESFTQADSSITRKHGGTGLGLAICRSLVQLMGGEIGVHSRPGDGSTFWFTAKFGLAAPQAPDALAADRGKPDAPRRGGRILVVEDNPTNRRLMRELLEGMGLQVTLAADGVEAVGAVEHQGFDLVLMDLQMPRLDGYQATARIRVQHDRLSLPIVAMTAHGRDEDREQCLAAGMNDHLAKPVDPEALAAALARWIPRLPSPPRLRPASGATAAVAGMDAEFVLPGVDTAAGLARAGHKRALYRELLCGFRQDHEGSARRMRIALAAGERDEAQRIAHNLKGTAGNLGARVLEGRLLTLERTLRTHVGVDAAMSAVEEALSGLMEAIAELEAAPAGADAPGLLDAERLKWHIDALAASLRDGNFQAVLLLEPLAQALAGHWREEYDELVRRVKAFEFDAAERALAALSRRLVAVQGEKNHD